MRAFSADEARSLVGEAPLHSRETPYIPRSINSRSAGSAATWATSASDGPLGHIPPEAIERCPCIPPVTLLRGQLDKRCGPLRAGTERDLERCLRGGDEVPDGERPLESCAGMPFRGHEHTFSYRDAYDHPCGDGGRRTRSTAADHRSASSGRRPSGGRRSLVFSTLGTASNRSPPRPVCATTTSSRSSAQVGRPRKMTRGFEVLQAAGSAQVTDRVPARVRV